MMGQNWTKSHEYSGATVIETKQTLWVQQMSGFLADNERKTLQELGEDKGGFFALVWNDCLAIVSAIRDAYSGQANLVLLTCWGIFKELHWFHFLFVSGNYPLLMSRLRYVWESMARASLAENYVLWGLQHLDAPDGPSPDEKFEWLEKHGEKLNWRSCIEPALRKALPLAETHAQVREDCKSLWEHLHKYVHASAFLTGKMIGESALLVKDNFDKELALETVAFASRVFDLIWLMVLGNYPNAADQLGELSARYPLMNDVLAGVSADIRNVGQLHVEMD
jgi:hypothetical protein